MFTRLSGYSLKLLYQLKGLIWLSLFIYTCLLCINHTYAWVRSYKMLVTSPEMSYYYCPQSHSIFWFYFYLDELSIFFSKIKISISLSKVIVLVFCSNINGYLRLSFLNMISVKISTYLATYINRHSVDKRPQRYFISFHEIIDSLNYTQTKSNK